MGRGLTVTATKTRIVLAGSRVHILGAFENIGMARERQVFPSTFPTPPPFLTHPQHRLAGPRLAARQGVQQPEDNRVADEGEVLDWMTGWLKRGRRGIKRALGTGSAFGSNLVWFYVSRMRIDGHVSDDREAALGGGVQACKY